MLTALPDWTEALLRLAVAVVLGGAIGFERERRERPAGLRTHALVCVASGLGMMISLGVAEGRGDPGRVAAGILTGMGFLGAGTIIRHGNVVQGLTTAASVWASAAVGLAVGYGWFVGAGLSTAMVFLVLTALRSVEGLLRSAPPSFQVLADLEPGVAFPRQMLPVLYENGVEVSDLQVATVDGVGRLRLRVEPAANFSEDAVVALICAVDGVRSACVAPSRRR